MDGIDVLIHVANCKEGLIVGVESNLAIYDMKTSPSFALGLITFFDYTRLEVRG